MSAFRKTRYVTAATVLACGTGLSLGLPAAADAASTVRAASQSSSNCTYANVSVSPNQAQTPWEITAANPGHLTDPEGNQLDGTGVKVAVVDTGIQAQSQLSVAGGTVLNGETTGDGTDDDGHGTMVASIIGAQKAAGVNGMQGIAPNVKLLSIREAGCNATQGNTEDAMAQAINDAVNAGAMVINISQDGYDPDPKLADAVQNAYNQGVVIVTSAGNQGDRDTTDSNGTDYGVNPRTYPASYPNVLAVGAVDQYGTVATFSETGSQKNSYFVGVVAPGVQVGGLLQNGKIATDDGTSFAAPYVAAEAALIIQEHHWTKNSDRTAARAYEVIKIIESSADGDGAYTPSTGWGEADIQSALNAQVSNSLAGSTGTISGLTPMLGIGPNADGQAAAATSQQADKTIVKPYVASAGNHEAESQQRWAYIALAAGLLTAAVALAGAAVARDTARRRSATQL